MQRIFEKTLAWFFVWPFASLCVLLLCTAGCRQDVHAGHVEKVSLKTRLREKPMFPAERKQAPLRFAIGTMISPEETVKYYKKIFDYVAMKLGRDYVLVQKNTYGQVNEMFRDRALDMAFIGSGAYVDLVNTAKAEIVAVPVVHGKTTYHSSIIVPADSPAHAFADLQGGTFAFVDPLSTSGRYF